MAIDLSNYETVEERISRFKGDWPDYRMTSELIDLAGDIGNSRWVVKVTIWKRKDDPYPAGMGFAFEVDGMGMANKTSALENCETSAFGRALANIGYSGNKRVTREEMVKPKVAELLERVKVAPDNKVLKQIWDEAAQDNLAPRISNAVKARQAELGES